MSQQSEFSDEVEPTWINWFCALQGHNYFSQVDEQYLKDASNLFGLKKRITKYDQALNMLLKNVAPEEQEIENPKFMEVYQHAAQLFGLIHARFIATPLGMSIMRQKFLAGKFGTCPRVFCNKQNVLPIGISEDLKIARVKVYCPRCKDIFQPRKKSVDVDGAFFGTSFPHLLLMTYPDLNPCFKKQLYQARLFGFKIASDFQAANHDKQQFSNQNPMVQNVIEHEKVEDFTVKPQKKKNKKKR